jgi:hypothetical protein
LGVEIKPFTPELARAVGEFNLRLKAGGEFAQLPEQHIPSWLPHDGNARLFQEIFLAVEDATVRGGYILKHQDFFIEGSVQGIADLQLPVSEGIVNGQYSLVGIQLLVDALKRQPLLYALGMGGYEERLPKLLRASGWTMHQIPFYFKVNHAFRFLRNISVLRRSKARRLALDFLAVTGLGWLGITFSQRKQTSVEAFRNPVKYEICHEFSEWADILWDEHKDSYTMVAVRDSASLNVLYPPSNNRFIRLRLYRQDETIGWVIVLDTPMSDHKQFGNMRVGSIVDAFAAPKDAKSIINFASKFLRHRGVDLIVSNQCHISWYGALKETGFIKGPSNFVFATSQKLADLLHPFDIKKETIHLNRGDGDGPINL